MNIKVTYNHEPSKEAMKNFMKLLKDSCIKHNIDCWEKKGSNNKNNK